MTKLFRVFIAITVLALLAACGGGGGSAGNTSGKALFTTAAQKIVVAPGASQSYEIGGGVPNYIATSSSGAATATVSGKNLVITGVNGGTATITVSDASGTKVTIDVTVGTGVDFFVTAPDSVTLTVGQSSSVFQFGGGSGIYRVNSSNPQVASVNQNGSNFFITGISAGKATVTATDSLGASKIVNVVIGTGIDLFTTAPSSVVVAIGASSSVFNIGGGSQVYSITSSNQNVATVGLANRTEFIITGKNGGTATVLVKDSLGASVTINVVVGSQTSLFSTAPANTKLEVGGSNIFKVGGGTTIYNVSSSNNGVVSASMTGNDLTITGVSVGVAQIVVADSNGASLQFNVTVGSGVPTALFTTAGTDIVVATGTTPTFTVGGGKAPYTATSSNATLIGVSISGATLTISGLSEGSGRVTVADVDGTKVNINVAVGTGVSIPLFTTAPPAVTVGVAKTANYTVGGGTGPYTFTSSNVAVATVSGSGKAFSVTGVIEGDANVVVRDAVGASITIAVSVSNGPKTPLFTTAPPNITIGVASPVTYAIGGGKAPFTVTSSNTTVATVSLGTNAFTVTGVSAGTGSIVVRDVEGSLVTVNFTVATGPQVPLFTTAPPSVVTTAGALSSFVASGGSGPYSASSSNTSVATVTGSFSSGFTITGVGPGNATVVVRDAVGGTVSIGVTIASAGTGTPIALFTSAPASLNIAVGSGALTYTISGGTAPYTVSSGNPAAITTSQPTASTFTISGTAVGNGSVTIRDAVGATVSVSVIVGTNVQLFTTSPASLTVGTGVTQSFTASGGTGPYTISSSNTSVATVTPSSGTFASAFTITGVSAGSAQVVVRDSVGASVAISVTISPISITPIDVLPGDSTGSVGDNLRFVISGGSAPFTVTNNNPSIATVSPSSVATSGGTFDASLLNAGSTVVSITDSQGQVKKITITANVASSSMRISPSVLEIGEDNSSTFTLAIKGGTAPYRVFTSDLVKSNVSVAGSVISVAVGTQGSRCIHPVDLSVPPIYQRGSTYTVTITALDSLGTTATSVMTIRDNSKGAGVDNCGN